MYTQQKYTQEERRVKDENFHETAKQRWQSKKKKKNTIKNNISMLRRMWCRVECSEREKKRTIKKKTKIIIITTCTVRVLQFTYIYNVRLCIRRSCEKYALPNTPLLFTCNHFQSTINNSTSTLRCINVSIYRRGKLPTPRTFCTRWFYNSYANFNSLVVFSMSLLQFHKLYKLPFCRTLHTLHTIFNNLNFEAQLRKISLV